MPRLTLQCGGALIENVTSANFFPPLFEELAQEPSINRDLLKGFVCRKDDFAIGRHQLLLPSSQPSFAHLEMAVLDDRRSDDVLDQLANCIAIYTKRYFHLSLTNLNSCCYITSDIRLIKARWHRSIARGAASSNSVSNPDLPSRLELSVPSKKPFDSTSAHRPFDFSTAKRAGSAHRKPFKVLLISSRPKAQLKGSQKFPQQMAISVMG